MLEFQTNTLKTRKNVKIDGQEYTVRRLGNVEQLELSSAMRRLNKLAAKEETKPLNDQESDEVEAVTQTITSLFVGLFDDHGDQSKSKALISSLSDTEMSMLLAQIFKEELNSESDES